MPLTTLEDMLFGAVQLGDLRLFQSRIELLSLWRGSSGLRGPLLELNVLLIGARFVSSLNEVLKTSGRQHLHIRIDL